MTIRKLFVSYHRQSAIPDEMLAKLFADGLTDQQIAERYGRSVKTVANRRRNLGLLRPHPGNPRRLASDIADRVRELNGRGITDAEIAKLTGFTYGHVRKVRRGLGLAGNRGKARQPEPPPAPLREGDALARAWVVLLRGRRYVDAAVPAGGLMRLPRPGGSTGQSSMAHCGSW